jgi:hypothetical protein
MDMLIARTELQARNEKRVNNKQFYFHRCFPKLYSRNNNDQHKHKHMKETRENRIPNHHLRRLSVPTMLYLSQLASGLSSPSPNPFSVHCTLPRGFSMLHGSTMVVPSLAVTSFGVLKKLLSRWISLEMQPTADKAAANVTSLRIMTSSLHYRCGIIRWIPETEMQRKRVS